MQLPALVLVFSDPYVALPPQANLMTGLVNMSMRTLCATDAQAYAVLATYMVAVSAIALVLHDRNIALKFW